MTPFLLAGTRPPRPGELSPAGAAHDLVAMARWHGWLRRWGLLLWFGLAGEPVAELRACLVVAASDGQAARRLAAGWGDVSGYRVMVLPLAGTNAGAAGR
jgi:hypothetical protein